MKWIVVAGVALACLLGMADASFGAGLKRITPEEYFGSDPVFLTSPPGDSRLFVVERGDSSTHQGMVRIIENGQPLAEPFLTVDNVGLENERGLMSLAFAPDYATSGLFYVFYVVNESGDAFGGDGGDIRIVEYQVSAGDPDKADPASARLVFSTPHYTTYHQGSWMAFGPDGHLYFTIGDDGYGPNAQLKDNYFGKIMRIDPADPDGNGPASHTVPADNPFVAEAGTRPEIYAYGLRNPFRASFAPDGRLVVGDVGNATWEEINAGYLKGANLGWPTCEGFCTSPNPLLTDPIHSYAHDASNCAVIGGYVLQDPGMGSLAGRYLYGDLCNPNLRTLDLDAAGADPKPAGFRIPAGGGTLRSFGEDSAGCVYALTSLAVFRVVSDTATGSGCPGPADAVPAATYNSFIPHRQVIGKRITVAAKCSIACAASATAKVRISRNRFRRNQTAFNLKAGTRNLIAGTRSSLFFRLPSARVATMRKAAGNGSRVTAWVKVSMTGEDGSGGSGSGQIRLTRPVSR